MAKTPNELGILLKLVDGPLALEVGSELYLANSFVEMPDPAGWIVEPGLMEFSEAPELLVEAGVVAAALEEDVDPDEPCCLRSVSGDGFGWGFFAGCSNDPTVEAVGGELSLIWRGIAGMTTLMNKCYVLYGLFVLDILAEFRLL